MRSTSSSSTDTPEAIDHVGIIAFNRLYEYGHNGIKKSNIPRNGEDPNPQYPGCKLRKREYIGRTNRSREEFIEWIVNVKYGEYRGSNYDMIHHNCLDFAKAVCIFLRVPPNPNWEKISNWAKNNQKIAGLFSRNSPGTPPATGGNRRSSSLRQTGRSMTIPEDAVSSNDDGEQPSTSQEFSGLLSSPRRRRLSVNPPISFANRSHSRLSFRSASMETLPPTYEEALKMKIPSRRDSIQSAAPSYESYMRMSANANNNESYE
ncbi:hypothetical protein Ocin01_09459 [Orchesella cincta]|uniref:PPPDE domain-containing protein n=1 Tax=Orchesella cincta TaxID=48709 RepID=A0A1D2MW77_ORCCI|nr:hypothetical protein Ocin01_09459 [Orchesella cincta]